jgi:hypothetical protein
VADSFHLRQVEQSDIKEQAWLSPSITGPDHIMIPLSRPCTAFR